MNTSASDAALVPYEVLTVTGSPPVPVGEVAVILVELVTLKSAAVEPKSTATVRMKLEPVMDTLVPPVVGPVLGLIEVTEGGPAMYVNRSALEAALVPSFVVTRTSTGPAVAAGAVAVTTPSELTLNGADAVPKWTDLTRPVNRYVPSTVTVVPPLVLPCVGLTDVTVGRGVP